MGKIGRRFGFIFAALVSSATCLLAAFAIIQQNFILFCISHLILGLGLAFAHQYRFAAAESVEKEKVPKNSVFIPPYSTLQIGGLKGGLARNVIADQCTVDWEMRPVIPEDGNFVTQNIEAYVKDFLLPKMRKVYPKANIKKEIIGEIIGFTKEEKSDAVNLVCNLTGDNSRDVVSFGTEAGLFQELGISTVVCGPGSIEQAHTIDEYVSFDQLKLCLKML